MGPQVLLGGASGTCVADAAVGTSRNQKRVSFSSLQRRVTPLPANPLQNLALELLQRCLLLVHRPQSIHSSTTRPKRTESLAYFLHEAGRSELTLGLINVSGGRIQGRRLPPRQQQKKPVGPRCAQSTGGDCLNSKGRRLQVPQPPKSHPRATAPVKSS